ncbi:MULTISPECIES: hypothetical protein [unclassified Microcystis]|jgi:hypothetical protein|uniref:hypothetical protein n=1 Tax=unclassified Microcystis TaxID=2643300 RepID=UPI00258BE8BC|nr:MULTISPECIES: hypothetical protein [unclassified Microcystis]MCA2738002.1 hypothetical protein [Microcystis sp. M165S2]MCA2773965.1 hypothetical protein [Microcystis sp. M135S2]MCA2786002.1 hypothetical protein [Microcystis sp. M116S2]
MSITRNFIVVGIVISFLIPCSGQTASPSSWPTPTPELIMDGYYTKQKLMSYWEWKTKTLPDLYIEFNDSNGILTKLKWEKDNFQYRFNFKNLGMEFVVDHQPKKNRASNIKLVEQQFIDTLNVKDYKWLQDFLKSNVDENRIDKNCETIQSLFRNIFIVTYDSKNVTGIVYKSNYCTCPCDDDEIIK